MAESKNMMVLNRDFILRSITGHSIAFKKGVPIHVPYVLIEKAQSIGALVADGEQFMPEDNKPKAEPMGRERDNLIRQAVEDILERANPDHFTAGGVPTLAAVSKVVGFRPDRAEINRAHQKLRKAKEEAGS